MSEPDAAGPKARLLDLLHRPARLGLVLNAAVLGIWYAAAYTPLQRAIEGEGRAAATDRERLALAREVEHLRRQADRLDGRLAGSGEDAWVPFLMGGVRRFPIKLVSLEPKPAVDVGPYKAAVLRVVVEGPYPELERFLRWLEGAPRLIRVESIRAVSKTIAAGDGQAGATTEMQLVLMGVDG